MNIMKINLKQIAGSLAISGLILAPCFAQAIDETKPTTSLPTPDAQISFKKHERGPKLSLSTEQMEKLRGLRAQFKVDTATKKAELKQLKGQMADLMSKPEIDKKTILAHQDKVNKLSTDLANARLNLKLASSEVLTAEQRQQMHEFMLRKSLTKGFSKRGGKHCGGMNKCHMKPGKRFSGASEKAAPQAITSSISEPPSNT